MRTIFDSLVLWLPESVVRSTGRRWKEWEKSDVRIFIPLCIYPSPMPYGGGGGGGGGVMVEEKGRRRRERRRERRRRRNTTTPTREESSQVGRWTETLAS